jgi:ankyrin repeat protein
MKNLKIKLTLCLLCFLFTLNGKCDFQVYFQYIFGPSPDRAKHMKSSTLFVTPLQIKLADAAATGDTNQMKLLIGQGADVNFTGQKGMKPLFWSLINQNLKGFTFLLDDGADPNATVTVEQPPADSALSISAGLKDSRYLEILLKHGADPNLKVGHQLQDTTPIFMAVLYGRTNNIQILLNYKANIDWERKNGIMPFHEAIMERDFVVALFLYNVGANPLIKDKWGYTPVDTLLKFEDHGVNSFAEKKAYKELVDELTKRGLILKGDKN